MLRSAFFLLASVMAVSLGSSHQDPAQLHQAAFQQIAQQRQQAIQLNDLASHLSSMQESRNLVNGIAETFADELPPDWATHDLRERIANAEYLSVTDPSQFIPEQRVADAWNKFARAIHAPQDALVTATEIHYMRDSHYTTAHIFWNRGSQNIWSMPNIYSLASDGKVAEGCRALEALRITYDLGSRFENLRGARQQVKKGILFSDTLKQAAASPSAHAQRAYITLRSEAPDPVRLAEVNYVRKHGEFRMIELVNDLINDLLTMQTSN